MGVERRPSCRGKAFAKAEGGFLARSWFVFTKAGHQKKFRYRSRVPSIASSEKKRANGRNASRKQLCNKLVHNSITASSRASNNGFGSRKSRLRFARMRAFYLAYAVPDQKLSQLVTESDSASQRKLKQPVSETSVQP